MTLTEIWNRFVLEYKRECFKRQIKELNLDPGLFASDVSMGQQDVQRRLNVIEKNYSMSLSTNISIYNLPSDFGNIKTITINDIPLKKVSSQKLFEANSSYGEGRGFALVVSGNTQQIMIYPVPTQTQTAILYYYPDLNFYSPTGITGQNWGTFNGAVFTGKIKLPDRYIPALIYYCLSKWFDDFEMKYETELSRLTNARVYSYEDTMDYHLGWEAEKQIGETTVQPGTVGTTGYSKRYRFSMVEGEQPQMELTENFTGVITISEAGGVITIASDNNEFVQPGTLLQIEPADMNYSIDSNQIQIFTYSGHETITAEIKVW